MLYLSSCCPCTNSLLPAFRNPSAFILYHQSAKVTRCVFDVLATYITKNNKLSGLRQHLIFNFCKTRKKKSPTFCYHSHCECHMSLFKNCVFIHYVFPLSDFGQWFEAAPHNSPQEETVELSGAVQHADRGQCDGSSWRRIHLLCFEWADGEKRFGISYSLWWVL